jgi:hypothetical protein
MMASITGWKCLWPNITAPSITSSVSSFASDSTIKTASGGASDHKIEARRLHVGERRVELVGVADVADPGGADRTHEGHAGQRQRRGGGDHGDDVGVVLPGHGREHGHDDLVSFL